MNPQSRTHKALLGAILTYGQYLVALGSAFFITPLALRTLGARQYGLWLSSGELVGYFLLLDFGVFTILPWLIARADGEGNTSELKRYLVQGLAVAVGLMIVLLAGFFSVWSHVPQWLHLSALDWQELAGPLCLLVVLLAVNLPMNIFLPLLTGLQDVRFSGTLGLIRTVLGPLLILGLLLGGQGLYALAVGTALFAPLGGILAFFRARKIAPHLLSGWPAPTWTGAGRLFRESIGAWLAGAGVQLMERSSAVVLTFLRNPAIVPTLTCTSRVGQMLTQLAWVMPDSALVGLAQLSGEGKSERLHKVTLSIIRLHLMLAGLMACVVLAINPAFVRIWVGTKFFGGLPLNLLLAAEVLSASFAHSLTTVVSVQGHRLCIGVATLVQGTIYIVLALALTGHYSLEGLLMADLIAPACSVLPVCLWLLHSALGLDVWQIGRQIASLVILRAGPCLLAAGAYGYWRVQDATLVELTAVGLVVTFVYLRVMRSQLRTFPLPAVVKTWLGRVGLIDRTFSPAEPPSAL